MRLTHARRLLVDVLSQGALAARRGGPPPPLLLLANKADKSTGCHSVEFVRRRIEAEVEALRGSRGSLADAGEGGGVARTTSLFTGKPGAFTFAGAGVRLTTASVSALKADVGAVFDWATKL